MMVTHSNCKQEYNVNMFINIIRYSSSYNILKNKKLNLNSLIFKKKKHKYSCSGPLKFTSGSCRVKSSQLFLGHKQNLPISNVNYVNKVY